MSHPFKSNLSADEVLARTAKRWRFDTLVPMPRGDWLKCSICGCSDVLPRSFLFRVQEESTVRFRCDASLKCTDCAAVWKHGVAIRREDYLRFTPDEKKGRMIPRQEVLALLSGEAAEVIATTRNLLKQKLAYLQEETRTVERLLEEAS